MWLSPWHIGLWVNFSPFFSCTNMTGKKGLHVNTVVNIRERVELLVNVSLFCSPTSVFHFQFKLVTVLWNIKNLYKCHTFKYILLIFYKSLENIINLASRKILLVKYRNKPFFPPLMAHWLCMKFTPKYPTVT